MFVQDLIDYNKMMQTDFFEDYRIFLDRIKDILKILYFWPVLEELRQKVQLQLRWLHTSFINAHVDEQLCIKIHALEINMTPDWYYCTSLLSVGEKLFLGQANRTIFIWHKKYIYCEIRGKATICDTKNCTETFPFIKMTKDNILCIPSSKHWSCADADIKYTQIYEACEEIVAKQNQSQLTAQHEEEVGSSRGV